VKKILLALLVVPSAANAQVPVYPQGTPQPGNEPPRDIDPGSVNRPAPAPAPAAKPAPAQPNVIVVGPDGKVTYDPTKSQEPTGYYYSPTDPGASFGYEQEPGPVFAGPTPELHVVRSGDTLWGICTIYFNDPWQWPKIWSYNPQITNPHWIYPGDLVRLLPRGMFAEQPSTTPEPDKGPGEQPRQPDNLPAPAQRTTVGLKQTAFVEKSDLDKSIQVDGSVDEKELLSIGDSVYLSYPSNNPPKVGQRYSIYKPDNTVKAGGKDVGAYVRILGAIEIVSVKQDKRARGVIVEANQEIERGAKVGPLIKQFQNVTPVPPDVDAQGSIVAMLTKEHLIGQGEVVFVDLGKGSGVVAGNRLFVVRRGDALPPKSKDTIGQDDRRFPARALGEIVIVEVGDKISVGLVTLAVQEMGVGDIVMMQKSQ
jgi:hypothetical protein